MNNAWYNQTIASIFETLRSGEYGLEEGEVALRLKDCGQNKLPETKVDSSVTIFLRQFQSPLIYVLFFASIIVFAMKEFVDGAIILFVLFFNAVVGTIQEGKAQNTLLALKKFMETTATAVRSGRELIVSDTEIVPGDIIVLTEGDKIPADARIIISNNLKLDESSLTGESEPVDKMAEMLKISSLAVPEQKNMVFKGTHIVAGKGRAVVTATGLNTAVGKIAKEIETIDTEIPLKKDIRDLSRLIIIAVGGISAIIFFLGLALGKPFKEMFTAVVSLSVSIIPEGLPIVVTLVLAVGVWRMSKRSALVKRLQAVETLGQARVIAVDKTGTITKNELVIQKIFIDGKFFEVGGVGYEPKGDIRFGENIIDPLNHPELLFSGKISAFCSDVRVAYDLESEKWRAFGDPTEAALAVFAEKIGFHKDDLEKESPKITEIPFDYTKKYHAVVHSAGNRAILTVVGAPEKIIELSSKRWGNGEEYRLFNEEKNNLESIFTKMSEEGFRVLALGIKENPPKIFTQEDIKNITFVGFVAMRDALRSETKEAMQKVVSAGIRVVMITGDHKLTAKAIAREAGIYREGDQIMTASDIDGISDAELSAKIARVSVFARVTPEHKLRIINAYRKRGEIVAMTGDGVNDAPSLVAADLGIAMGKIGTEVAKEASDIILLDDNFGSIVSAIEEGRSIYKTIKKVILYLFSTSIGEVLTIAGALLLGYPLPLLAAQIIWLNLVTDGFLDVALAMEPKEEGLLKGSFERPKKYLIDKLMVWRMVAMSVPMTVGTIFLFGGYFETDIAKAWTISLTVLAAFQWFNAWNCRHESKSVFHLDFFSNKFLTGATLVVILLQIFAVYNPFMQKILHTVPLSLGEWVLIVSIAFSIVIIEEVRKFFYRRQLKIL
jgi:Ca2+-transporting ATPase